MARLADPGEVVGVDYSEGMLATARERAEAEGLSLTLVHARAEEFIATAPARSLDAVSLRFALAYLDWRAVLPPTGRTPPPRGRARAPARPPPRRPPSAALSRPLRQAAAPGRKRLHSPPPRLGGAG